MSLVAAHIQAPNKEFRVKFERWCCFNGQWSIRQTSVLAVDEDGAIQVAKYHYPNCRNFELVH